MINKNALIWVIALVVLVSLLFKFSDLTGSAVKDQVPMVAILNPVVQAGNMLAVNARNVQTTQEFSILKETGEYSGFRFYARATKCKKVAVSSYECNLEYSIPAASSRFPEGNYFVQTKDRRTGRLIGNKAAFRVVS